MSLIPCISVDVGFNVDVTASDGDLAATFT